MGSASSVAVSSSAPSKANVVLNLDGKSSLTVQLPITVGAEAEAKVEEITDALYKADPVALSLLAAQAAKKEQYQAALASAKMKTSREERRGKREARRKQSGRWVLREYASLLAREKTDRDRICCAATSCQAVAHLFLSFPSKHSDATLLVLQSLSRFVRLPAFAS